MWADFGFAENPYATEPIPASEEGDELLVGRDAEIRYLEARIQDSGAHPTLEGDNGVGKTSLISVVCYRLRNDVGGRAATVFLPAIDDAFQLLPGDTPDLFVKRVYLRIASTIVAEHDFLKERGLRVPNIGDVRSWLNSPVVRGWGASLSLLGQGGSLSRSQSANTSPGFTDAGLLDMVNRWLRQLFPSSQSGGFICVIDNLELLETTLGARTLLEAIRDPLFNRRGLRWILCGARGIMRTSAASPRLSGRIAEPMEVRPISDRFVEAAIERRIARFRINEDAVAPVGPYSFRLLYDILNRNLREAFRFAEDFAFWLYGEGETAGTTATFDALFQIWLATCADQHNADTQLGKRAWQVFDQLSDRGGSCSPSDYRSFGFNAQNVMRSHIKALEAENLVTTTLHDESDKRRKTIVMTSRGWLVHYARCGYRAPRPVSQVGRGV
ncbi:hypothetical protein [Actinophytocola sediminis]